MPVNVTCHYGTVALKYVGLKGIDYVNDIMKSNQMITYNY